MNPIYTCENCQVAYQLNWSLSVFWQARPPQADWLGPLKRETEPDGVRVIQHRYYSLTTSQFFLSTRPDVAPEQIVRSVKGRLQYLIRDRVPKAFQRNYGLRSIGSPRREVVEKYVASQAKRFPMASPRDQRTLESFQIVEPESDLSRPRNSAHGQYWYNLHLVLVRDAREEMTCIDSFRSARDMLLKIACKREYMISRAAILPDHIHVAMGCPAGQSPLDVALCVMNNLAYAFGMEPGFQFGFYVGTFGEYDRGVVNATGGDGSGAAL